MQLFLIRHIRKIILLTTLIISICIFTYTQLQIKSNLQIIHLSQIFALTALFFLYITLLPSALYSNFSRLPWKAVVIKSRQSLGLSACFFAILHAEISFYFLLGGINGLYYLQKEYLLAVALSSFALTILVILAITSHHKMIAKLGRYWKPLHRMIYIAALAITVHALILGSHFRELSTLIPRVFFIALVFLLTLEILRFDKYIFSKFPSLPKLTVASLIGLGLLLLLLINYLK